MNKKILYFTIFVLSFLLSACGGARAPQPSTAVLNGVTRLDRVEGRAELSVSGLNEQGGLFTSGRIANVSATVNEFGFGVTGGVCGTGQIESSGALTTILTLDASGSMSSNDRNRQRGVAAKTFIRRMSSGDLAAIASFTGSTNIPLWQDLTADKTALELAIDKATSASGSTNLWGASVASINYLASQEGVNKVAVIFTDGEDTAGRSSPNQVISLANANNIRLFMIGLGNDASINVNDMTDVASATNGFYRNVNDSTGLDALFNTALNASKAAGCIDLVFQPIPATGSSLTGELNFSINGKGFISPYSVQF